MVNVETDLLPKYQRRFGHPPRASLAWSGLVAYAREHGAVAVRP